MKWKELSREESLGYISGLDADHPEAKRELAEISALSPYADARSEAVSRIDDQDILTEIALRSSDYYAYGAAIEKLSDEAHLEMIAMSAWDDYACRLAVRKISNQSVLLRIAQGHIRAEVRAEAVKVIENCGYLQEIAETNSDAEIRAAAVKKLNDQDAVSRIALSDPDTEVFRAAIDKINDRETLAGIVMSDETGIRRRAALRRLQELGRLDVLGEDALAMLAGLADDEDAAASVIRLLGKSGYDWIPFCGGKTVKALNNALAKSRSPEEARELENSVRALYGRRSDLRQTIQSRKWTAPDYGENNDLIDGVSSRSIAF